MVLHSNIYQSLRVSRKINCYRANTSPIYNTLLWKWTYDSIIILSPSKNLITIRSHIREETLLLPITIHKFYWQISKVHSCFLLWRMETSELVIAPLPPPLPISSFSSLPCSSSHLSSWTFALPPLRPSHFAASTAQLYLTSQMHCVWPVRQRLIVLTVLVTLMLCSAKGMGWNPRSGPPKTPTATYRRAVVLYFAQVLQEDFRLLILKTWNINKRTNSREISKTNKSTSKIFNVRENFELWIPEKPVAASCDAETERSGCWDDFETMSLESWWENLDVGNSSSKEMLHIENKCQIIRSGIYSR